MADEVRQNMAAKATLTYRGDFIIIRKANY